MQRLYWKFIKKTIACILWQAKDRNPRSGQFTQYDVAAYFDPGMQFTLVMGLHRRPGGNDQVVGDLASLKHSAQRHGSGQASVGEGKSGCSPIHVPCQDPTGRDRASAMACATKSAMPAPQWKHPDRELGEQQFGNCLARP